MVINGEKMLDKDLLSNRLENFWGLGRFEADYWFVGMEEGGGNSEDEVSKRLQTWSDLGCTPLVDNYQYHIGVEGYDFDGFFDGNIRQQATWAKLIRTMKVINDPNNEYKSQDIKDFQSKNWGRCDSENCLIEIFPLPSPNANHWNYDNWSDIPILRSRESYKSALRDPRIKSLGQKIDIYKPKLVLMYGMSAEFLDIWSEVAKIKFNQSPKIVIYQDKFIYCAHKDNTLFVVTYQPNAVWANAYWEGVGKKISELIKQRIG